MLFAGSRSEVGPLLGIGPDLGQPEVMQERNKICLQSDPPQCFDIGDPLGGSSGINTNEDLIGAQNVEDQLQYWKRGGQGKNWDDLSPGTKEWILKNGMPVKKAEVPETWNEGTGIEKGGYENAPQWLRDQLWKQDLKRRQELGLEPVVS